MDGYLLFNFDGTITTIPMKVLVFHDGALFQEFPFKRLNPFQEIRGMIPKGSYICLPQEPWQDKCRWFRSDFTPVLLNDVPPNYRAMVLIYT